MRTSILALVVLVGVVSATPYRRPPPTKAPPKKREPPTCKSREEIKETIRTKVKEIVGEDVAAEFFEAYDAEGGRGRPSEEVRAKLGEAQESVREAVKAIKKAAWECRNPECPAKVEFKKKIHDLIDGNEEFSSKIKICVDELEEKALEEYSPMDEIEEDDDDDDDDADDDVDNADDNGDDETEAEDSADEEVNPERRRGGGGKGGKEGGRGGRGGGRGGRGRGRGKKGCGEHINRCAFKKLDDGDLKTKLQAILDEGWQCEDETVEAKRGLVKALLDLEKRRPRKGERPPQGERPPRPQGERPHRPPCDDGSEDFEEKKDEAIYNALIENFGQEQADLISDAHEKCSEKDEEESDERKSKRALRQCMIEELGKEISDRLGKVVGETIVNLCPPMPQRKELARALLDLF